MTAISGVSAGVGNGGGRLLVDLDFLLLAQHRQRLEAGDAEQPCGHLGAAFEGRGLPPQFEENFVGDVVGHHLGSRLARREPVDPGVVAHEQEPYGGAVPLATRSTSSRSDCWAVVGVAMGASHEAPAGSVAGTERKVHRVFQDFDLADVAGRAEGWVAFPSASEGQRQSHLSELGSAPSTTRSAWSPPLAGEESGAAAVRDLDPHRVNGRGAHAEA